MPPKPRFQTEDIIDAAFDIVRKEGWNGLSARAIAKKLNSSTRPIYSYLESMKSLEEEIVKKALALFNEYLSLKETGDKWLDQAIGYVRFAIEEKMLFRCINDEKHAVLQRKNTREMWEILRAELANYKPFENLSQTEVDRIRVMRWIFVHGIAALINSGWYSSQEIDSEIFLKEMNIKLPDVLNMANHLIYEGFKDKKIFEKLRIGNHEAPESKPDS